jgi:hypothetical protein
MTTAKPDEEPEAGRQGIIPFSLAMQKWAHRKIQKGGGHLTNYGDEITAALTRRIW